MAQINFKNREEADAAVADVRADSSPTNWFVVALFSDDLANPEVP
jgi:hypothetical protein